MFTNKTHHRNPDSFDIAEFFNEYITNHNEKIDLYLPKYDFELVFDNQFGAHNQSESQYITIVFHLKRFLLHWIEYVCNVGHNFCHIREMTITTRSNMRCTTLIIILNNQCKSLNYS